MFMFANKNLVKKDKDAARIVLFIIRREILNILNEAETVPQIQENMRSLLNKKIDACDKLTIIKDSEIKSWKDKTVDDALKEFDEAYKNKTDETGTAGKSINTFVDAATKSLDSAGDVEQLYKALELKPVDNKHSLLDKRKWGKGKLDLASETYSQVNEKIKTLKEDKDTDLSAEEHRTMSGNKKPTSTREAPKEEKEFRPKTGHVSKKNNDSESTQKIDDPKRTDPQETETKIADSSDSDSSEKESKGAEDVDKSSFCKELNKKLANGHAPKLEKMAKSGVQKTTEGSNKATGDNSDLKYHTGKHQKMLENNVFRKNMKNVITEMGRTSNEQDGDNGTQENRGEKNQGAENKTATAEIDRHENVARPEITQTAPDTGKMSRQQKKEERKRKKEENKRKKEEDKIRKKEKKRKKNNKKQLE